MSRKHVERDRDDSPSPKGKGQSKEGYDADIVIFDSEIIGSDASITDPIREPKGIEYVFVNGAMRLKYSVIL